MLCAAVLYKMKHQRYVWVAIFPTSWLLICTMTAGYEKVFSTDPKVGFLALANSLKARFVEVDFVPQGTFKTLEQVQQVIFNNQLNAGLTSFFMIVVVVLGIYSIKTAMSGLKNPKPTANEVPYESFPEKMPASH